MDITIGIIGGSGIYSLDNIKIVKSQKIHTPFGMPSDDIIIGKYNNKYIAFLARHGRGHYIMPGEINNRANIWALKSIGVKKIISISAVGSLKEEIKPGDFVIPDQLFDRTKTRISTFFGEGIVGHVSFAEPYCNHLSNIIYKHKKSVDIDIHFGGTYICIEGPQFSTKAESNFYRMINASIIGMTNLPEAKLAKEAELCYSTIALVTDYDVWKDEPVTVEMVIKTMETNVKNVKKLLNNLFEDESLYKIDEGHACYNSLKNSIMTDPSSIPISTRNKLSLLIDKYYKN